MAAASWADSRFVGTTQLLTWDGWSGVRLSLVVCSGASGTQRKSRSCWVANNTFASGKGFLAADRLQAPAVVFGD